MQIPSAGRIVLALCAGFTGPRPAMVTGVNTPNMEAGDHSIDIAPYPRPHDQPLSPGGAVAKVPLFESQEQAQAAIDRPGGPLWAAFWMPYQVGQAAKTEEVTSDLKSALEANNNMLAKLDDRVQAGAEAQRDVNTRHQKAIENLSNNKEAGPMGGRLAQAIALLASACSGEQQQQIKNILDGVEATPAE